MHASLAPMRADQRGTVGLAIRDPGERDAAMAGAHLLLCGSLGGISVAVGREEGRPPGTRSSDAARTAVLAGGLQNTLLFASRQVGVLETRPRGTSLRGHPMPLQQNTSREWLFWPMEDSGIEPFPSKPLPLRHTSERRTDSPKGFSGPAESFKTRPLRAIGADSLYTSPFASISTRIVARSGAPWPLLGISVRTRAFGRGDIGVRDDDANLLRRRLWDP